ncbi:MAG: NAD(P)H-binding protein [Sphingomonadaceae bacterium]|nr:NAD(P)H-binding protein [Sphingomonadaceae bacterium]
MARILVIGATGLVGRLLADGLLADGAEIHALLRRSAGRSAPGWHEHVAPPADWPELARTLGGDVAISTLGTTWRAAGSEPAFRAVDLDAVVAFAAAAKAAGVQHMITVSSVGADAGSRAFYLRVKGEMEAALRALGFARLDINRPGLLRGDRGPERRLKERAAIFVSPLVNLLLRGRLDRYAAIDAALVANAIAALAMQDEPGAFVHHNRDLRRLAALAPARADA